MQKVLEGMNAESARIAKGAATTRNLPRRQMGLSNTDSYRASGAVNAAARRPAPSPGAANLGSLARTAAGPSVVFSIAARRQIVGEPNCVVRAQEAENERP